MMQNLSVIYFTKGVAQYLLNCYTALHQLTFIAKCIEAFIHLWIGTNGKKILNYAAWGPSGWMLLNPENGGQGIVGTAGAAEG
jgi:hypothetical protein